MPPRGPQQVLYVQHRGEWKMVGKIFRVRDTLICLHEEGGNQSHRTTDSPGGVDHVVVDHLERLDVKFFVHARKGGECWSIPVSKLRFPFGNWHTWDGRERIYVPYSQWHHQDALWFSVPHIPDEYSVYLPQSLRNLPDQKPSPRCSVCGRVMSITVKEDRPVCGWCRDIPRRKANESSLR